ncbi:MAG: cytochrome C [Porphyromonas sp.]|nr:cytochrome C [Porphyromonas sp.]
MKKAYVRPIVELISIEMKNNVVNGSRDSYDLGNKYPESGDIINDDGSGPGVSS